MTKQDSTEFMIGDWRVSPAEGLLSRGDEIARLEPKAMDVLTYLASHPGEVITREELERDVWHGAVVGYDAVTNTVIKLRKALQDSARQPRYIATIPKKGYQLIAPVSEPVEPASPAPATRNSNTPHPDVIPATPAATVTWYSNRSLLARFALAIAFITGLLWLWATPPPPQTEQLSPAASETSHVPPSIVVLPFKNMSRDPKQEYLADGITEDIITDLSRISDLLVIASNTSFAYKDKHVSLQDVASELNVRYVLKGSIRQVGDAVRVNTQLINAKTGYNTWAQRYDRKLSEVFTVQDEVTQSIVDALAVKVTRQEKKRLSQRTTNSLKAYDLFQEGQKTIRISTRETNEQARALYRKALEIDPDYGRAYGALAYSLASDFRRGWTDAPLWNLDFALELAKKAVALDNSTPQTYWALGFVYLSRKEYDNARQAVEQAINIAPNYADGYGLLALISSFLDQPARAIKLNNKAIRLNPYYTFEYLYIHGMAHYRLSEYDKAIAVLERAQERNENAIQVKLFLIASYVQAGRQDDAEWLVNELQLLSPNASITSIDNTIPIAAPNFKLDLLGALRKAGLPE